MEPNRFAGGDAFTVALDEPKGQCIRSGDFANIPTKTTPRSTTAGKTDPQRASQCVNLKTDWADVRFEWAAEQRLSPQPQALEAGGLSVSVTSSTGAIKR